MPRLPQIEQKPEVFAMAIDTEGSVVPKGLSRKGRIDRGLYRYQYYIPIIVFASTAYPITEKIANMLNAGICPSKRRKQRIIPIYYTFASTARAARATYLMQPHTPKFPNEIRQNPNTIQRVAYDESFMKLISLRACIKMWILDS